MNQNTHPPYNSLAARPSKIGGLMSCDVALNSVYDERVTTRAWEALLEGKNEAAQSSLPVRSTINDSWHRCATGGIDAQRNEAPIETDKDAVDALARMSMELLTAAALPFEAIGKLLNGTGAMLMLADAEGVLINVIGDKKTIYDGMDIHLGIGGKWTEDVVGTNGIGTALWTGEPVFVHAAEHFCAGIKSWTCAGAPIRDPFDGKVIGVVDLSGHPDIFRPHNIALVTAAAREIERALADSQNDERMRLLEAFITSVGNYRSKDGVMIIDRHGRAIYSNNVPIAERKRFGDTIREGSGRCRLPELSNSGFLDSVTTALPREMQSWHLCPLELNGEVRGAAFVFPKLDDIGKFSIAGKATSPRLKDEAALIIGESEALRKSINVACKIAESEDITSLLIEGETGVGKELFARLVHSASRKSAKGPFVALNCGAITKELFGSELFGHIGGAFTGSSREGKPGVFEHADGGVLSLDEIGEMPLDMQPFLLRVLEERAVTRLGDSRLRPVDVRLVASTNRNLKTEVDCGRFRKDLFYRVSTVSIHVPPLRERGDDSILLIEHFSRKLAERKGSNPLRFSNQALDSLLAYKWPGNVRELRNVVERLHLLSPNDFVDIDALPAEIVEPSPHHHDIPFSSDKEPREPRSPIFSFEDAEREAIKIALAAENGNLSKVAQRLGVSRPTLYRKLDQFGIKRSRAPRVQSNAQRSL